MQMWIKVEKTSIRLLNNHEDYSSTVLCSSPILDCSGPDSWQVVQQVAIVLEKRPKDSRHCEVDLLIWNIWNGCFQIRLPHARGTSPTGGTKSRFTGVIYDLFVRRGDEEVSSQF